MGEAREGNIIQFKPRSTGVEGRPIQESAKIIPFPSQNTGEGTLSAENQEVVDSAMVKLGEELVDYPIGAMGGFLDTAVDQPDPKLFRKLLEGGAYGLMWQAVPALAVRPDGDATRNEYLVEAYEYLQDAVADRKESGTPLFLPTKPSEVTSSGAFNFGDSVSAIGSVRDTHTQDLYIEANAQRAAAGVLGIADGARHPMIDERITKDRNFLITTLMFKKRFPDKVNSHLRVIK